MLFIYYRRYGIWHEISIIAFFNDTINFRTKLYTIHFLTSTFFFYGQLAKISEKQKYVYKKLINKLNTIRFPSNKSVIIIIESEKSSPHII